MANPRSTDTKIPRVTRQATSAPVDTYVQPDNSASQLAEALGEFNPKLMKFSQEWAARANSENLQAGIAEAQKLAAAGKEASALTREGALAMQDNAWFKAGLEEEKGRLAASVWRSDFIASDEFKAIEESTSLDDFDSAATKFSARFGKSNSGSDFYQRGFGTLQSNYQAAARYEFASGIEGKLGSESDAVLFGRTVRIVTEDVAANVDPQVTIAAINMLQEQTIARGRPAKFVRKAVVDAMDELARKMEPMQGLKLVNMWESIKGEGDVPIGQSKYGMEKLDKLRDDLIGEVWRKESRDLAEGERQEKQLIEAGEAEFQKVLAKNGADTGQSLLAKPEYASVRAKLAARLSQAVQINDNLVFRSNEYVVRNTLSRIFDPTEGKPEVTTSFIGSLRNVSPSDKVMLNNQLEAAKAAKGSGSWERLFKDPAINEQRRLIEGYFADPITKIVPREKQTKLGGALTAFNARVLGSLESGEYDMVKTGERLAWLSAVRAEVGGLDLTIMNGQEIQGVSQYQLDPNQPELGNVPIGKPAGRLGDRGQPQPKGDGKKVQGSESGAAENPFTGMKLSLDRSVLDALVDEMSPGHDRALMLVANMVKAANQPVTEATIQFFIDAQAAAALAEREGK